MLPSVIGMIGAEERIGSDYHGRLLPRVGPDPPTRRTTERPGPLLILAESMADAIAMLTSRHESLC